jgi:DNA-binding transcriptional regulator YiaG
MAEQGKLIEEAKQMVSDARETVYQSNLALLDAYYKRIRELYQLSSSQRQTWLRERLEKIVNQLEGKYTSPFDPEVAKRIRREQEHVSQGELAHQLQISLKSIVRYETPGCFKESPPRRKEAVRYLEWLKERGYNPFNL